MNHFTVKSQEALDGAQKLCTQFQHAAFEPGHILLSLLSQEEGVVRTILASLRVDVGQLEQPLRQLVESYPILTDATGATLSRTTIDILEDAQQHAKQFGDEFVSTEHLLLALVSISSSISELLASYGVTTPVILQALTTIRGNTRVTDPDPESSYQAIEKYTINMTQLAREKKLDPVIGRDQEIRRVIQVLSRRTKNNPVLIGEAGTGKTAIVEGLAQRIISGDIPEGLKGKDILNIDMGAVVAGTKFRGEFEQRLKTLLKEIHASHNRYILFIDELHTVIGAGAIEGAMDAANLLKPALARGELRMVGATTLKEYQRHIEKDPAFERRFQPIVVGEPTVEDAITILRGVKEKYEIHHGVRITDSALVAAAQLSDRYITERSLPDKAIDCIDEAASALRMEIETMPEELDQLKRTLIKKEIEREALKKETDAASQERKEVLEKEIAQIKEQEHELDLRWTKERDSISSMRELRSKIEEKMQQAEIAERSGELGKVAELRYGVIPQLKQQLAEQEKSLSALTSRERLLKEEVTDTDVAAVVSRWTGIPLNQLMQTEAQRLLHAEEELTKRVIGQEKAIEAVSNALRRSRVGLSDRQRPLGSFLFLGPTGVGKTELAKALAEFIFNSEQALVRVDMTEYMERHSTARLIGSPPGYVGYEEGGQLTEKIRRRPYSVILFDEIEKAHPDVFNMLLQILDDGRLTDGKGRVVNFKNTIIILTSNIGNQVINDYNIGFREKSTSAKKQQERNQTELRERLMESLKQTFKPEFLNRLDDIIVFSGLTPAQMQAIVEIQMQNLTKRLEREGRRLVVSAKAKQWLAKTGYDPVYGARPLRRLIEREIVNPLAQKILENTSGATPATFTVDAKPNGLHLHVK